MSELLHLNVGLVKFLPPGSWIVIVQERLEEMASVSTIPIPNNALQVSG